MKDGAEGSAGALLAFVVGSTAARWLLKREGRFKLQLRGDTNELVRAGTSLTAFSSWMLSPYLLENSTNIDSAPRRNIVSFLAPLAGSTGSSCLGIRALLFGACVSWTLVS